MIKKLLIKTKTARIVFYIKTLNVKVMKNNSKCISSIITVQIMQSPNTTINMDWGNATRNTKLVRHSHAMISSIDIY